VVPPYDHFVSDPNFEGYRCVFAKKPFFTASAHLGAGLQKSSVFWHFLSSFAYHNLNGSASNKTVSTPPKLQQQRLRRQQWLRPLRLQRLNWLQPLIGDKNGQMPRDNRRKQVPPPCRPCFARKGKFDPLASKMHFLGRKYPKMQPANPQMADFRPVPAIFSTPKSNPKKFRP
jgi:hypothetical protein